MTSIILLVVLAAIIVFVLRMKTAPLAEPELAVDGAGAAVAKPAFTLPEWGRVAILFAASLIIGLIVSTYLNPTIIFVGFAIVGFLLYYRTEKGKQNVHKGIADFKAAAAPVAASAVASAKELAKTITTPAPAPAAPQTAPSAPAAPVSNEQLLDQIVSATRIARMSRKTLDGELLPSLAGFGADDPQRAVVDGAIKNSRATFDQARKVADEATGKLVANLSADTPAASAAISAALAKESVAADPALTALFQHIVDSADMARFDEAGYKTLLRETWVRATENPGLSNSPI